MQFLFDLLAFVFWVLVIILIGAILPRSWRSWLVRKVVWATQKVRGAWSDAKEDTQAAKDGRKIKIVG